jgi:hypothetical protein
MSIDDELMNLLFKGEAKSQLEQLIERVVEDPLARAKIRAKMADEERKKAERTLSPQESADRYILDLDAIADRSPALAEVVASLDPAATKTLLTCQKATLAWLRFAELVQSVGKVEVENREEALEVLDKMETVARDANKLLPLVHCYLHILARTTQVDFGFLELLDLVNDECFASDVRDAMLGA